MKNVVLYQDPSKKVPDFGKMYLHKIFRNVPDFVPDVSKVHQIFSKWTIFVTWSMETRSGGENDQEKSTYRIRSIATFLMIGSRSEEK